MAGLSRVNSPASGFRQRERHVCPHDLKFRNIMTVLAVVALRIVDDANAIQLELLKEQRIAGS